MKVIVDPRRLSARQLTIRDVRDTLRAQNLDTSGGDFWEDKRRWNVRTLGQFRSPQQVANQILAIHDGAPVYVGDVAEVKLGHKKPDGFVRRFGKSCISVNVQRETGANVLDVMRGLQEKVAVLNAGVLKDRGLVLTQVYDETDYIESAVGLVNQNIVVGGFLTVIVLLVFLRSGRSTLVIGLAIPTSIIGTLMVLNMSGTIAERHQPGGIGLCRRDAGRQCRRGAGEHLPPLPGGRCTVPRSRARNQGGLGCGGGIHLDHPGRVLARDFYPGRGRPVVPRYRTGYQRRRWFFIDCVRYRHSHRSRPYPAGTGGTPRRGCRRRPGAVVAEGSAVCSMGWTRRVPDWWMRSCN